jgi:hypothetical protein
MSWVEMEGWMGEEIVCGGLEESCEETRDRDVKL